MATYAGAIPVTSVVCPPWCTVTQQSHLDDLENWEGQCIHWNRARDTDAWYVDHVLSTFVDGTPSDEAPGLNAVVKNHVEFLTLDQAEEFARAILAAVEEARS
jgi:hypothetical protein